MKPIFLVFLGGGVGSVLRYLVSKAFNDYFQHFFLGTYLVNSIGCLLIGFILGFSFKNNAVDQTQLLLLVTGFCGGFTTFSAFAFEKHSLLTTGEIVHFALYTLASIVTGLLAVGIGLWLARLA